MADEAWLRNLAHARFAGGQWQHQDPLAVRRLAETRLDQAVSELEGEAHEYAEAFNDVAQGRRAVRVLPVCPPAGQERGGGFIMLLGRCQLSLEYKPPRLEATLHTIKGFERIGRLLHRFEPQADAFGSLAWRMDNALIMTAELIIKRLFEDLTRAACEAGEITAP